MALTLVLAALSLSACGTAAHDLPPGPSSEEVEAYLEKHQDQWWRAIESNDVADEFERPDVALVEYITSDEWPETMAACLTEQGIEGVSATGGGLNFEGSFDVKYQVAEFACTVMYPTDPSLWGFMSKEQLAYIYDYWVNQTAPCLRLAGIDVPPPPPRTAFIEEYYTSTYWSPYMIIERDLRLGEDPVLVDWKLLDHRCPPLPAELGMWSPAMGY